MCKYFWWITRNCNICIFIWVAENLTWPAWTTWIFTNICGYACNSTVLKSRLHPYTCKHCRKPSLQNPSQLGRTLHSANLCLSAILCRRHRWVRVIRSRSDSRVNRPMPLHIEVYGPWMLARIIPKFELMGPKSSGESMSFHHFVFY